MKRFWNIVLCVLSVVPLIAQEDYYFTLLDHWNWKGPNTYVPTNLKKCAVSLCAAEDVDFTFSTPVNNGQTTIHVNQGNNSVVMIDDVDAAILNGVSIHSSGASSININIIGTTSAAETAVLPKRLLGTKYMVQGAPGLLVDNLPVYSQFTVVGIENGSSIRVKPRVAMTCVTTGVTVPAGQVSNFQINEKQVLLFQPVNYEDEISGTVVESDRKIAVFQGNNITRIPVTANWSDFVYEQARPISSWGKEFVIPKASGLMTCDWKIIAGEDNTEVYIYANGSKVKHGVKNAGEWFTKTIYSASSDLQVDHIVTSKPVCCYLYMTGSSSNNSKGDPEMIEIVPVDKMATEARWGKAQTNDNTPHTISLLVTAPQADETKVQYNSQPLSSYATQSGVQRAVIDGFVVYQIPFATANGVLLSAGEGFSAHIIHYAKTAEGTGYNVSLPEEMPEPTELCMDGILLFREDFGGNDPDDPIVGNQRVPGMDYSRYTQRTNADHVTGQPGLFWLIKSGYYHADTTGGRDPMANHSNWYLQDDHTYPNDKTRGYLLEVDGLGGRAPFYSTVVHDLCPATRLTFSAYVANVNKASNYIDGVHARIYPRLRFELENANDGTLLASHSTGDIPYDSTLTVNTDFFYSSKWYLHGLTFTVPGGVDSIRLTIYNDVESNGAGNDFALDDIEIHLCLPPVSIAGDAEVCENSTTTLTADFTNDGTLAEPLEYKWWHSEDSLTWAELSNTSASFTLASVQKADSGWYKVAVAGAGNIENINCRALSEPFRLTVKDCEPPVPELCMDGILLFREDFGGNNPTDPRVSTMPVQGMTYEQATTDVWDPANLSVRAGKYIVTKSGYCNGDTAQTNAPNNRRSQWFIQDDHTYPNDYTRGYFMEVDGKGDNAVFYTTTIDGLCAGIELTFLAYVANLQLPWYYENQTRTYPRLKFSLLNPVTNELLRTYDTGDIPYDSLYMGLQDWNHSSKWHPIGMNFVVPENINAVTLEIANNAIGNNGNDFAIDDIEIRLCMTPDTITSDTLVCDTISQIEWRNKTFAITDTLHDTLRSSCGFDSIYYFIRVETEHCEPPCPEMHYATRDTTVCDTLMPFTWHGLLFNEPGSQTIILKDEQGCDSIEIDYTLSTFHCEDFCLEGELLFREDFGGNDAGDSEISCAHVSGIANLYTNACQEVRKHPEYGMSTMNYVLTKKGQGNRQWHVQDDHTYPNDYTRGYFLEVDGYGGTIYKTTVNNLYEGMELTFSAYIANLHDSCVIANMRKNYGYTYPRFKFILKDAESNAELATYTTGNILPDITTPCVLAKSALWQLKGMKYVVPEGVSSIQMLINNDVASYDGNDFGIDDIEIRLCYMPAKKIVQDTIICDTIDNIVWRNKIYPLKNELRDTVYDSSGADSIYYILNVTMEHCCPEIKEKTITIGTLCDTLLPYTLYFRDTVLTFKMAGDILLEIQHPQWDCIDSIYILHLDTMHCERLYPIIVNKYNWQLLCHNVRVRELFPELTVNGYQWYKDGMAIPNATEDDYSEQNELQGAFQLRLLMNNDRYVWSEILTIQSSQTLAPSRIRIYNHNGYLFYQSEKETTIPSLPRGLYIIQIEQNGEQRIEKKLIP